MSTGDNNQISEKDTMQIKFLRSSQVYDSLEKAVSALNNLIHSPGQPVIVYYYSQLSLSNNNNEINCLFAIGKKNGQGRDSYSVISFEEDIFVNKILINYLPDITELNQQDLFLSKISDSGTIKYFWIYKSGAERIIEEVKNNIPIKIKELNTHKEWWISNSELKETSNFVTKEEYDDLLSKVFVEKTTRTTAGNDINIQRKQQESIDKLTKETFPLKLIINHNLDNVYEEGILKNLIVNLKGEYLGEDVTNMCKWYLERSSTGKKVEINKSGFTGEVVLENCSQTETFKFIMEFPVTRETLEESIKVIFSANTIIGKIKNNVVGYGNDLHLFYINSGKRLLGSNNWINSGTIQNAINQEKDKQDNLSDKRFILRTEDDEVIYKTFLDINEYPFIAIPKNHKPLADIIDEGSGMSILEDFDIIEEELDLIRNIHEENKYHYKVYLKKTGSKSKNKEVTIIFKP